MAQTWPTKPNLFARWKWQKKNEQHKTRQIMQIYDNPTTTQQEKS